MLSPTTKRYGAIVATIGLTLFCAATLSSTNNNMMNHSLRADTRQAPLLTSQDDLSHVSTTRLTEKDAERKLKKQKDAAVPSRPTEDAKTAPAKKANAATNAEVKAHAERT